jgi:hypothetical protein
MEGSWQAKDLAAHVAEIQQRLPLSVDVPASRLLPEYGNLMSDCLQGNVIPLLECG